MRGSQILKDFSFCHGSLRSWFYSAIRWQSQARDSVYR
jgi:hypothetical protein